MSDYYGLRGVFASSREPPPDEWPILGSALELSQNVLEFLVRKHREYGPIFRMRALGRGSYLATSPSKKS